MAWRLEVLAKWYGDGRDGVLGFVLARKHVDVRALEGLRLWRHAYLGRYMGMTVRSMEAMSTRRLRSYVEHISDIVKKENGPPPKPQPSGY